MFWAEIWNISEFFIWKFPFLGGKIFSTLEKACFRNAHTTWGFPTNGPIHQKYADNDISRQLRNNDIVFYPAKDMIYHANDMHEMSIMKYCVSNKSSIHDFFLSIMVNILNSKHFILYFSLPKFCFFMHLFLKMLDRMANSVDSESLVYTVCVCHFLKFGIRNFRTFILFLEKKY